MILFWLYSLLNVFLDNACAYACSDRFSAITNVSCHFSLYNHIQLSSNLISGCDYSLFKVGLSKEWYNYWNP